MNPIRGIPGVVVAALLTVAAAAAQAGDGRVPLPAPARGQGEECVEPVEIMRRYHMEFLDHQRDDTARRGIRDGRYSLKECVACHAVPDPAADGERTVLPFCEECHAYAAVRTDCFQCHTPKPAAKPQPGSRSQ